MAEMTEFPLLRHLMWELADVIYEELDGNLNRRRKSLLAPRFTRITSRTNVSVPRTSRERDLLLRGHDTILKTPVRVGRKPGGSETERVVAATKISNSTSLLSPMRTRVVTRRIWKSFGKNFWET